MALVKDKYRITRVYADNAGKKISKSWDVDAADHATATTYGATIATAYDALTSAVPVSMAVSEVFTEDSVTFSPNADSNATDRVIFTFDLETEGKSASINVPAPEYGEITLATSGSLKREPNLASTALETYADLYRSPSFLFISDGEQLGAYPARAGRWLSIKSNG